jgi:hypothetical protein
MTLALLTIYELRTDEERPYALETKCKKRVELDELATGDPIDCGETWEITIKGYLQPSYKLLTIRRAEDGIGIELVHRTPEKDGTQPIHTLYPRDALEQLLTKCRGYYTLDDQLRRCGL